MTHANFFRLRPVMWQWELKDSVLVTQVDT